jgi:hypothetical protein
MKHAGLIAFGVALIPMSVAAYFVHRDLFAPRPDQTPTGHAYGSSSIGDYRFALLQKLTRSYVAHNSAAPAAMRNGTQLAPADFLNEKLEAEGAKWRVRNIRGLVADTYPVT